jgi:biopolymer transport protein ExbD
MILQHQPLLKSVEKTELDSYSVARQAPEINLIPFIDVLLVILIFLMISTTFTQYQELSITLPSVSGETATPTVKEIRIAVSKDGKYAINSVVVENKDLAERLQAIKGIPKEADTSSEIAIRVVISADAKASHQSVMQVLEVASLVGINNIVFATQDPNPSSSKKR